MNLLSISRLILRVAPPKISKDDAVDIAERALGSQLMAPVTVHEGLRAFTVVMRSDTRPPGWIFEIDATSGEVLKKWSYIR
jgi:Zn-dependent metalloprotease